MTRQHRAARVKLEERLAEERRTETLKRIARLPTGLPGLWQRITGQYQAMRAKNDAEAREMQVRHANELQRIIDTQREERAVLQAAIKTMRREQAEQLVGLRKDLLESSRSLNTGERKLKCNI